MTCVACPLCDFIVRFVNVPNAFGALLQSTCGKSTWDVMSGQMSAAQQQKFHTDDVKSVWNLVRSSDWSM